GCHGGRWPRIRSGPGLPGAHPRVGGNPMRLWWTWVRRSYAPFFLPVGIGIALALRLDESTYDFRYEWYWASAESGSWLFFGGAVLAGASAWEAWLTRRRNQALTTAAPNPHAGRFSVFVG